MPKKPQKSPPKTTRRTSRAAAQPPPEFASMTRPALATVSERNGNAAQLPPRAPAQPSDPIAERCEGRLASEIAQRALCWLIDGLVPDRTLTFVVGQPQTGKSTFGAWLCAQVERSVILPGQEEDVEVALIPRLEAVGVRLTQCLILDSRPWKFPQDRQTLTIQLRRFRPALLWIDPIDSYVQLASENDPEGVRAALESLCRLAREVPCAVVCARHPGKNPQNLCPGSRQWRAVPRMILELRRDIGPPERRYLRTDRDPAGRGTVTYHYTLEGAAGEPKRFVLGDRVGGSDAELSDLSDPIERRMIDEAQELIRCLLTGGEQDSSWIYTRCEQERLKERTVRYAARRMGVVARREGSGKDHRCLWSLPDSGTPADTHTHPPL